MGLGKSKPPPAAPQQVVKPARLISSNANVSSSPTYPSSYQPTVFNNNFGVTRTPQASTNQQSAQNSTSVRRTTAPVLNTYQSTTSASSNNFGVTRRTPLATASQRPKLSRATSARRTTSPVLNTIFDEIPPAPSNAGISMTGVALPSGNKISIPLPVSWNAEEWYAQTRDLDQPLSGNSQLQEQQLRNQLEICGVKEIFDENPLDIAERIAMAINQDPEDVVKAYRKRKRNKENIAITVTLIDEARDRWLLAAKTKSLTLNSIGRAGYGKVYLRESLAPATAFLLWKTKDTLKGQYKFIWSNNGSILLRKQYDDKIITIRSLEELERIKNGQTTTILTCTCTYDGQNLKLIELLPGTKGQREYDIVMSEMHKTLGQHNIDEYNIVSVFKVVNCCLWKKFKIHQRKIGDDMMNGIPSRGVGRSRGPVHLCNEKFLFHGTTAADSIVRTGFDISRANPSGMFGAGIYFAEHSSKSNQYSNTSYLGYRCMLICRVALGKQLVLKTADKTITAKSLRQLSYHSVRGTPAVDGLRYPEHIIYNNNQAYPEYLVKYNC